MMCPKTMCQQMRQKFEPYALLILRVVLGVIMAVHGWQKLQDPSVFAGHLTGMGIPFPTISAYLAIAAEFLGGLGLIVGLLTPIAAFGVAATMFVAVTQVHWSNGLLAQNNGFEYPLTLLAVALYFLAHGGGCISLDALLCKKKEAYTEI